MGQQAVVQHLQLTTCVHQGAADPCGHHLHGIQAAEQGITIGLGTKVRLCNAKEQGAQVRQDGMIHDEGLALPRRNAAAKMH